MRPSTYRAFEPNVDGRSTNKFKKNITSFIITSILSGLTDATRHPSSCNRFALGVSSYFHQHLQEKEVPESVDILKPSPCQFCLREK